MAAGRAARTVSWITGNVLGEWAVQSGWLGRARTHPRRGRRGQPRARLGADHPGAFGTGRRLREELLRDAIAIGRRFGDPDVEFEALAHLGAVLILTGRVEEGLVLIDEALAAACAGELAEIATVDSIFCWFFWACELVNDVPRADQWMRAAADLMQRRNSSPHSAAPTTAAS